MRTLNCTLVILALIALFWALAGCTVPAPTPSQVTAVTATPLQAPTAVPTEAATTTLAPTSAATGATTLASGLGTPSAATTGAAISGGETTPESTEEPAHPSNPGGPGPAENLAGNAASGEQIYTANCAVCHGPQGKGGVPNPGSADGTVPALNPIDPTLANKDANAFAKNVDLFIEHGSSPEGPNPALKMPNWGDTKSLTPQQISDVIAYIMSLNPQ